MKNSILFFILFIAGEVSAQKNSPVAVIDLVKIKNDHWKEALYFYQNNWKVFRDSALKKNYIRSYRSYTGIADTSSVFDIILITEYADSDQLKHSEAKFSEIIKEMRPAGPKLLNDLKPGEFLQRVSSKKAEISSLYVQN